MFWFCFIVYLWCGVHISLWNSCATRQLASRTLYFIFVCSPQFLLDFSLSFVYNSIEQCMYSLTTSKTHEMHPIVNTNTIENKTFICLFWVAFFRHQQFIITKNMNEFNIAETGARCIQIHWLCDRSCVEWMNDDNFKVKLGTVCFDVVVSFFSLLFGLVVTVTIVWYHFFTNQTESRAWDVRVKTQENHKNDETYSLIFDTISENGKGAVTYQYHPLRVYLCESLM